MRQRGPQGAASRLSLRNADRRTPRGTVSTLSPSRANASALAVPIQPTIICPRPAVNAPLLQDDRTKTGEIRADSIG